jgi:hypothetical protein
MGSSLMQNARKSRPRHRAVIGLAVERPCPSGNEVVRRRAGGSALSYVEPGTTLPENTVRQYAHQQRLLTTIQVSYR